MRIDAYNQIGKVYQTPRKSTVSKSGAVRSSDQVEISQFGKDYQIAKQAVAEAPDVRAEKVAQIKNQIDSGAYEVGAEELAGKLTEQYTTAIFQERFSGKLN